MSFTRHDEKGRPACQWHAVRGARTRIPGPWMPAGRDLPHDLAQYVAEAATGASHGFWGLLAAGATFRSTGRRVTRPGRALILAHRDELDAAEAAANAEIAEWKAGRPTPIGDSLDRALDAWRSLGPDDRLVFDWPSPDGRVLRQSSG